MSWPQLLEKGFVKRHGDEPRRRQGARRHERADADPISAERPDQPFVDVYAAYLNVPSIGRTILGDKAFDRLIAEIGPDTHALMLLTSGRWRWNALGEDFVPGRAGARRRDLGRLCGDPGLQTRREPAPPRQRAGAPQPRQEARRSRSAPLTLTHFALDLARASDDAFDPTVQPLWPLWRDAAAAGRRPSPAELSGAVSLIDWRAVEASETQIAFGRPGMAMMLNGILQGYASDLVLAEARRFGVPNAFVDTGELGAYGASPDGGPWRLGLAETARPEKPYLIEDFVGFAATSAGVGTPFSRDGADNHLFDPRTGLSPHLVTQTAVFAKSGMLADGLSTAAYVMGEARGLALAERLGGRLLARRSDA